MTEKDTAVVHKYWVYYTDNNAEFVRRQLVNFPSVALRDSNGCLAGWCGTYFIGEMGMLYVLEGHRGKGLAKCLIYELAKKLIAKNRNPYSFVDIMNVASVKGFEKCGFRIAKNCDTYYKDLLQNT